MAPSWFLWVGGHYLVTPSFLGVNIRGGPGERDSMLATEGVDYANGW